MARGIPDDYVMVNERIQAFAEKYPDGSLQSEILELTDKRVVIKGVAYRSPADTCPGVGHSALEIPGRTPFTRGSEVENCETSAWGRALAALGFEVKRGIASLEEVAMKRGGGPTPEDEEIDETIEPSEIPDVGRGGRTKKASPVQVRQVNLLSHDLNLGVEGMKRIITQVLGDELFLPEEPEESKKILLTYLNDLDREDIAKVIQQLGAMKQAEDAVPQPE